MKTAAILLALAGSLVSILPSAAADRMILSPDEKVSGISQSEWSTAWWQWAGSFDREESPIADSNGERCQLKQSGPVWFLASTYGTKRTIRTCKFPRDKYLFFPLINYVFMPPIEKDCHCTCDTTKAHAKAMTDNPEMLVLDMDGQRFGSLETHRQATRQCFDMGAKTPQKYRIFPSAADGYYVMLPPLSLGKHVLNFGGALPSMLQAVTYTLDVE